MKTNNTARAEKIVARLADIPVKFTTTVCDRTVTRWTTGYEIDTYLRAEKFLSAEEAAAILAAE